MCNELVNFAKRTMLYETMGRNNNTDYGLDAVHFFFTIPCSGARKSVMTMLT